MELPPSQVDGARCATTFFALASGCRSLPNLVLLPLCHDPVDVKQMLFTDSLRGFIAVSSVCDYEASARWHR
jgi:hypothetical protein